MTNARMWRQGQLVTASGRQAEDRAAKRKPRPVVERDWRRQPADLESGLPNGCNPQGIATPLGTRPVNHAAIEPIRLREIAGAVVALLILGVGLIGAARLILRLAGVIGPEAMWP